MEFLDKTGLTYVWGKIKDNFVPKNESIRHYSSLTEISSSFTSNTALATIYDAMETPSILSCNIIGGSSTIYPQSEGSLMIYKNTAQTGAASFVSYEGENWTGGFGLIDS